MTNLRVGRPKTAIAGGVLALVCALLMVLLLSLGLTLLSQAGYKFSAGELEGVTYTYIYCGLVLAGGVLILWRRYILGGALALVFSILLAISVWYIGVWGVIGGVLSLISREKIQNEYWR